MPHFFHPYPESAATMTRRFPVRHRRASGPLAVIPMINVALLLWMFSIVNSAVVLKPGVPLALPSAPFAAGERFGTLVLTLSAEGMMFLDDERVPDGRLMSVLRKEAAATPLRPLLIEADGQVRHETLVEIYTMASAAGFKQVMLATRLAEGP